ncbi:endolytic transglycosylase MltG [Gracilinema caldarium]|uniref:Endolytic murein transglycosylase n=1 Tax=Gracilinema caldarium (strain ATCC 51460 / DSM 7334 / H1) TaxID=744872 RepID=F8F3G4_GRAC1|nr:endolytic transglycosylase MltG [Gracilinema caldarium]AEJ19540.1 aminodeoxychorismate lyase [Gracilinema caldarium DSM 7334]
MSKYIYFLFRIFAWIVGSILVVIIAGIGILAYINSAPAWPRGKQGLERGIEQQDDGSVLIEIFQGESASQVGKRLAAAGLIRSALVWNLVSRFSKEPIKAGFYSIHTPESLLELHQRVTLGQQLQIRVTIPEGVTLSKIALIFEQAGICESRDFMLAATNRELLETYHIPNSTFEGYLFPDTYLFPKGFQAAKIITHMAETFFTKLKMVNPEAMSLSPQQLHEKVILASIIEREYRVDDEAPLMASVFYNRLTIGMALQSCATVEYVISEIQGKPHPEVLYYKDIAIQNPYNTYIRPGLPPGPISNPGLVALRAVFYPAQTNFLYFRLVDPNEGRHRFSKTLDEHLKAGVLYVKGRAGNK